MDLSAIQMHSKGKAVLNRCVLYKLQDLTEKEIGSHLNTICKQESIKVDSQKANILMDIAEYSKGSLRTAISLLERCIFSNLWTKEEMYSDLGIITTDTVGDILHKIIKADYSVFSLSNFNKDLIIPMRTYLLNAYKTKKNIPLAFNSGNIKKEIQDADIKYIEKTLDVFNQLKSMPYMDYISFESSILKLMNEISASWMPTQQNQKEDNPSSSRRRLLENT
jgi:DNA polymerase III gamma/tau subunit